MEENVTFNITVTMKERWINDFCSFLKLLESYGNMGHSALVGFYADGDGDFHPTFDIDCSFDQKDGIPREKLYKDAIPEVMFDAG